MGGVDISVLARNFRRCHPLGFSDCLVLEVARKAGHLPLGTFDRRLGKMEGAQGL
jgi:predicted nucleic acid-binding protein